MRMDDDWNGPQPSFIPGSAIRLALIFGSVAVALGLVIAPLAEERLTRRADADGLDFMSTGSVGSDRSYTIRRSVLQASPESVCIIRSDGAQTGDCR
ncbi:hypothetical protein [Aquibium sp. ELW1220]|jgi:hypothetical protein|uniref:hypothetical protein n=1 Tax=Aquibium sp. ELW1220 TaxID=2976766 RepID=UPI0025B01CC7|nr:hypothetical protein [Aquibium sp. ELW1220]MDN2578358.1 hypothetical protein [Aquibium sp. ELW1220]